MICTHYRYELIGRTGQTYNYRINTIIITIVIAMFMVYQVRCIYCIIYVVVIVCS